MEDVPDRSDGRERAALEGEVLRGEAEQGAPRSAQRLRVVSIRLPRWLALLLALLLTVLALVIGYLAFSLLVILVVAALLYRGIRRLFRTHS